MKKSILFIFIIITLSACVNSKKSQKKSSVSSVFSKLENKSSSKIDKNNENLSHSYKLISKELTKINNTFKGINKNTIKDFLIDSGMFSNPLPYEKLLLSKRKIILTTKINNISSKDIISKLFILEALNSEKEINLYLRTTGGWLNDAYAIINTMNSIKPKVNVIAIGPVESAGTVILISATGKRLAYRSSYISVHANRTKNNRKYSKNNVLFESFEEIYRKHTKIPERWYPLSSNNYYLNPKQAKEFGIIDEILD